VKSINAPLLLSWFVSALVAIKHYFGGYVTAISSSCVDQGIVAAWTKISLLEYSVEWNTFDYSNAWLM